VTPEINAICTIMIVFVTIGVLAASLITKRAAVQREREARRAN
jgi:putrescine transport system permease protein